MPSICQLLVCSRRTFSCPTEKTVIINLPCDIDVIVGESVVLPCQVSKDPSIEVVFSWSFNGDLIDFKRRMTHFERAGGVSLVSLLFACICFCFCIPM